MSPTQQLRTPARAEPASPGFPTDAVAGLDPESRAWVARLSAGGADREEAIAELHELLLAAARFELDRRRAATHHLHERNHDDLAQKGADDALVAILRRLGDFRNEGRFTTWACKFAISEAASLSRRRAWQEREVTLAHAGRTVIAAERPSPQRDAGTTDLWAALQETIDRDLTPHQREVLVAVELDDVPIDVLAERLDTTRGALYETIHDARRKLRAALAARGFGIAEQLEANA